MIKRFAVLAALLMIGESGSGFAQVSGCDQTCAAIKQILANRANAYIALKGKKISDSLWESKLAPPGLYCTILDFDAERGIPAYSEMDCGLRGVAGLDYPEAQVAPTFQMLKRAISAAVPQLKAFRVTDFSGYVADLREADKDTLLYIGPSSKDYFMNLEYDQSLIQDVKLTVSSTDTDTSYPLVPYPLN